jgi:peptidoglycan hydrolase-like protein with peptidoglycan-binding domain
VKSGSALPGKRRLAVSATLAAAVMTGAVGGVALTGGKASPASPSGLRLSTATVERTNLATTVLTGGTLGYASSRPLINELAGTYTRLRAAGTTIRAGHVLYRVDNQPVFAMRGRTPAWRAMAPGISGPDVRELQADLIALGYASGLFITPSGVYDAATDDAVQRWQIAADAPVTGVVEFGQVIFVPGPVRVGALNVAPGQAAAPGQQPYQVTTTKRIVSVPVNPTLPTVAVGERVSIVLPSQARTSGRVTAVGASPPAAGTSGSQGSAAAGSPTLTVTPDRPGATGTGTGVPVQVSLTVQSVRHVLAVPVSALLALSGGGYALELVTPSGRHRLVGVTAGIFAGGLVQVSGAGVVPGVKVVVAQ